MSKKHKMKALRAQLADSESRRVAVEVERDELERQWAAIDFERIALRNNSDAFARNVLRAAGANGNGDLGKVRRLARGWLDS